MSIGKRQNPLQIIGSRVIARNLVYAAEQIMGAGIDVFPLGLKTKHYGDEQDWIHGMIIEEDEKPRDIRDDITVIAAIPQDSDSTTFNQNENVRNTHQDTAELQSEAYRFLAENLIKVGETLDD